MTYIVSSGALNSTHSLTHFSSTYKSVAVLGAVAHTTPEDEL